MPDKEVEVSELCVPRGMGMLAMGGEVTRRACSIGRDKRTKMVTGLVRLV
jgi:hypothetical protein